MEAQCFQLILCLYSGFVAGGSSIRSRMPKVCYKKTKPSSLKQSDKLYLLVLQLEIGHHSQHQQ